MALWLIRAGSHGEFESKFLGEDRVYLTWNDLAEDLSKLKEKAELIPILEKLDPEAKPKKRLNHASQIWPFVHVMKPGDWVVLPMKTQQSVYIGEIKGDYHFEKAGPNPYYHWRQVEWIGEAIPRSKFGQDLLHSFGAFLTICSIKRNNAEARVRAMKGKPWKEDPGKKGTLVKSPASPDVASLDDDLAAESIDLEQEGLDRISMLIQSKFSGHGLTWLVEAILKAEGYTTYLSPEGADGGADILAGKGALGFGGPQLCVEVKSHEAPVDRETVDKLLGAMSKFNAPQGLFVSWSGFKKTVQKELAQSFFKLRLWSQKELLEALFTNYDKLEEEVRAELPLKRIWTVAAPDLE